MIARSPTMIEGAADRCAAAGMADRLGRRASASWHAPSGPRTRPPAPPRRPCPDHHVRGQGRNHQRLRKTRRGAAQPAAKRQRSMSSRSSTPYSSPRPVYPFNLVLAPRTPSSSADRQYRLRRSARPDSRAAAIALAIDFKPARRHAKRHRPGQHLITENIRRKDIIASVIAGPRAARSRIVRTTRHQLRVTNPAPRAPQPPRSARQGLVAQPQTAAAVPARAARPAASRPRDA